MKTPISLFAAAVAAASLPSLRAEPVPIFNGKDLSGWHGHNPHTLAKAKDKAAAKAQQQKEFPEHWTVEDGVLVNDGHGPYATTDKDYGDIELRLEYKTVPEADSGIYLRGTPQVQIWDITRRDEKAVKNGNPKGSGALWNNSDDNPGKFPLVVADKPFGEWNQVKVKMAGARTWVWLNDKLTVDGAIFENFWTKKEPEATRAPLPATGPIHLQTHGGEIRWRNIAVEELSAEAATALLKGREGDEGYTSIFNGKDLSGWAGAVDSYEVKDGAIYCKQDEGGNLYHEEELSDFKVRLEFLLPPGGNNGLAIRYPGEGGAAYDGFCELQVLDNTAEKYKDLDKRQFHGSAYGIAPAHRGYLRPVGEWNYQEVTVKGSRVTVELNGTVIFDADLSKVDKFMKDRPHPGLDLKSGYFGFAGHKDPVGFRNIEVKKLK